MFIKLKKKQNWKIKLVKESRKFHFKCFSRYFRYPHSDLFISRRYLSIKLKILAFRIFSSSLVAHNFNNKIKPKKKKTKKKQEKLIRWTFHY